MFAFQWREFSPPFSSAHRLLQCYHLQKRDRRRCNSRRTPPQPPASRVISQWASSLEWRHAVTLHILVGKICISFFLFYCEGVLSLVVLRLWFYPVGTHHRRGCDLNASACCRRYIVWCKLIGKQKNCLLCLHPKGIRVATSSCYLAWKNFFVEAAHGRHEILNYFSCFS